MSATAAIELDPRTPVLVGVGQASERLEDPGYRRLSPVELAAQAAQAAIADAGAGQAAIAAAIDTVAGVRQFEISHPRARSPLGRSDNYPRSVAGRVGAAPARAILEVVGGQAPQHLVNELAATIAAGGSEVALIFGSEAISTLERFSGRDDRPDFTEHAGGDLEDRGYGMLGMFSAYQAAHGLTGAPSQYALAENARRARLGMTREAYATAMGSLFEPFTRIAAANPHAAAPTERSAAELATPTEANRPIADPYTRYIVAREKVNQGAAVLLMSVAAAGRLGVPADRWVFLHGHADLREQNLLARRDLSASPAAVLATRHALDLAGIGAGDLRFIDLYSCFPVPVFNICDGLGLAPDDPRGLTVTGGLPFFGGAGSNYSMHAIAEVVQRVREHRGSYGLVGANGGIMSKYSVGVYSATPAPWRAGDSAGLQEQVDGWPARPQTRQADGWATIDTYTVRHGKDGARTGIVVGRLESNGLRFLARSDERDHDIIALLSAGEPVGDRVYVRSFGFGNRVTVSRAGMDELFPPRRAALRDGYEHVLVHRNRHLLEVTINRPEVRNSLHPAANEELDEVFDAYFADDDLWVAILTGAGDKAFSAGNDLLYSASGKPVWVPKNGFAGLTSRPDMPKPVIAAVNGYAMGGGLEIALACHLIVADATATFALSEVKVGLVATAGGLVRLPQAIPPQVATEMILTGRRLTADKAYDYGLVSRLTEAGGALDGARALAAEILDSSPTSVRISLRIMAETQAFTDTIDAVSYHSGALDELMLSQDAMEGVAAFVAKRKPQWRNR
jgi:acetyl-CoA C-acetyltransferase